jgi:hypothetical protein
MQNSIWKIRLAEITFEGLKNEILKLLKIRKDAKIVIIHRENPILNESVFTLNPHDILDVQVLPISNL